MINLGTALSTGASGLLYIWDGMRQLGSHPSSSPTIGQTNPDQPA
jgi:hypothetical protein